MIDKAIRSVPRLAWLIFGGIVLALVVLLVLSRCSGDGNKQVGEQAKQTQHSAEAIGNAAQDAIATFGNREATEENIAAAVDATKGAITDAPSVDAIHSVVAASLCQREAYRADPACTVREADPR